MNLYNISLQRGQAITKAISGSFTSTKSEEIIVARGTYLEVFTINANTGKISSSFTWESFGQIRSILPFRLAGTELDYIVLGSDSGRIVILKYEKDNCFKVIQSEVFGKTGCRRVVPGQYLAKDPKGRALMVGAIEKQKLVYILDRDKNSNLIISSPLQAHKSNTICFGMVGLDVEYENPLFACLEIDCTSLEDLEIPLEERVARKIVTYYELDLGLNTVTRKNLVEVDPQSNLIFSVPGGDEGPGGCLVFSFNWVVYISEDQEDQVKAPFPERDCHSSRDLLIITVAVHVQKDMFFFLAQSEMGDLYKITLEIENAIVKNVFVKYFDTIPQSRALCVSKLGFLFSASEFGDHFLFSFKGIGDEEAPQSDKNTSKIIKFIPSPGKNLSSTERLQSLAPITDLKILNPSNENSPQIFALCGKSNRSSLRVLRYGLEVTDMAVSSVPGTPTAVWSVKRNSTDKNDSYIIVSFLTATLVLSIGEMVEEVSDSGFLANTNTICASLVGSDTLMQIHNEGIRLICSDTRVNEWKPPIKKTILDGVSNGIQVSVLLSGGEVVFFESDDSSGLVEVTRCEMGGSITCLALAPVPEGNLRSRFMAVGGKDKRVRLLDLDGQNTDLEPRLVSTQMLESPVSSLSLCPSGNYKSLCLFVGTVDGRLAKSVVDLSDGKLSSGRQRYLGSDPVKLFNIIVNEENSVLALSSKPWLSYDYQGKNMTMPLAYPSLDYASTFSSEQCTEGVVSICGKSLRIWTLENLSDFFHSTCYKLRYTPRILLVHPVTSSLIICEAEHNSLPFSKRSWKENTNDFNFYASKDVDDWSSCVRILDPENGKTVYLEEFKNNLAAFSMTTCIFQNRPNEIFLIIGVAKKMKFQPSKLFESCAIRVYRFYDNHCSFKLLHQTEVEDVTLSFCPFQGKLLAGVGNVLRLYDLGKRKLLKKLENRQFSGSIRKIHCVENRIFVTDMISGVFVLKYSPIENTLKIFADNPSKFYSTTSLLLDNSTIALADKFGNFTVKRLMTDEKNKLKSALNIPYGGFLNSAGSKLETKVNFYVGDTITCLEKAVLTPGGSEVILYSTIHGTIGCFYPLKTREEIDFFVHLETHMRQNSQPLTGRNHLDYRSSYFPVKSCIDGELCEQFNSLSNETKNHITNEMVMNDFSAIQKRIEIIRSQIV